MKRTKDGLIKEEREVEFFPTWNNNYLSRSVEFLKINHENLASEDQRGQIFRESSHSIDLKLQIKPADNNNNNNNNNKPNLFVRVISIVAGFNQQIYGVVLYKKSNLNIPAAHLEVKNGETKGIFFTPIGNDGEPIDIMDWLYKNTLYLQIWKYDSQEEVKKSVEFTDCVIYTMDNKQKFRANINTLVSSQVIYNMIQDLQIQQYSNDNPLDLSELFRGFEDWEIYTYLCFVYNSYCTPIKLEQILSLLKISIKLDNQGLIQRILGVDNLGNIVRDQIVMHDKEHVCYVQNVLNFAKQHDFHKLMVFCCLEIICEQQQEGRRGEMEKIIGAYEHLGPLSREDYFSNNF